MPRPAQPVREVSLRRWLPTDAQSCVHDGQVPGVPCGAPRVVERRGETEVALCARHRHVRPVSGLAAGDLRHGYTVTDVDRMAAYAVLTDLLPSAPDWDDRVAEARCAIVTRVLTEVEPPTGHDLITLGRRASMEYARRHMAAHGYQVDGGGTSRPRFQRYWTSTPGAPLEERIVERIAVGQILPLLPPLQQAAVSALAVTDDQAQAAAALGIPYDSYRPALNRGRRRFRALWHEGEPPSGMWREDRRNGARNGLDNRGRPRITESELDVIRSRHQAGETLEVLAVERGYTRQALGRLLLGKTRAADAREVIA